MQKVMYAVAAAVSLQQQFLLLIYTHEQYNNGHMHCWSWPGGPFCCI